MTDTIERINVEDVRKLALPLGTRVVAGDGLLSQPVSWTTVIYPEDGTLSKSVQRGEMILVAPQTPTKEVHTTDLDVVRWASDMQASAVVLSETPSPNAIAEANAYGVPVLTLPHGSRIRLVEKAIVSLLVDRKGQLERRGTQIYRQLTQISSRNEGMAELVNSMARLTNKSIVVQDKRLRVLYSSVQPQFIGHWEEVETFLRKLDNLPVEFQDRHRVSESDNPVLMQSLPTPTLARLVSPIVTKDVGRGYLSIIGWDTTLDDIDTLVAEHGAAACALEMAKAKAISDTEKRLRGTFLDRLLIGDVSAQEAVRQGERFDHDMTVPHIAIVLSWRGDTNFSTRRLETTVNSVVAAQRAKALVWQREREEEIVVFYAYETASESENNSKQHSVEAGMELAKTFTAEILRQYPRAQVAAGLGQVAREIGSWRVSYRDAVQALELARRLQTNTPLFIGDLGVYQLILSLSEREKLLTFCDRTLGALEDYDQKNNGELVRTLRAFFECHGNLSETAVKLIVHRNTLLYRVQRIKDIAGIDLDRPEMRLALQLSLTIRQLLALN
jgi:purine catabolism regulator